MRITGGRELAKLGHTMLLFPARIVKPFVQGNTKLTIMTHTGARRCGAASWTSYGAGENRTAEESADTTQVAAVIDQKAYPVDEHADIPAVGIG